MSLKTTNQHYCFLIALLFFISGWAQPETDFENTILVAEFSCDSSSSNFKILGESSLHDWEMISENCKGSLILDPKKDAPNIKGISLSVEVASLKSGRKIMDKKCYNALKSDDHPKIKYTLNTVNNWNNEGNNKYTAILDGTLEIAGTKRTLNIDVKIDASQGGRLNIKGDKSLKMTDFKVEPPKALLGTLKTADEITITFNLNFIEL